MILSPPNPQTRTSERAPASHSRWLRRVRWPGILRRGSLFALVWWIVVEGEAGSLWIGAPAVLVATMTSVLLHSPATLLWYELFRFVPFFLIHSLIGGADVAWRAIHPRMPIAPHFIKYPIQLPSGLPRVFMANTVSLLPGTLSVDLASSYLMVHVLAERNDVVSELSKLEQRVAALFGVALPVGGGGMR